MPLRFSLRALLAITALVAIVIAAWPAPDVPGIPVLEGVVVDIWGRPVSGIEVQLCDRQYTLRVEQTATTGPDGSYRFPAVTAVHRPWRREGHRYHTAEVIMRIRHPVYCSLAGDYAWRETIRWNQDYKNQRDIVLTDGITLTGTLVRADNDEPLPDVELRLLANRKQLLFLDYMTTDPDGNFRITGLPPGRYTIDRESQGGYEQLAVVTLTWDHSDHAVTLATTEER